jgi:hypothetical protein
MNEDSRVLRAEFAHEFDVTIWTEIARQGRSGHIGFAASWSNDTREDRFCTGTDIVCFANTLVQTNEITILPFCNCINITNQSVAVSVHPCLMPGITRVNEWILLYNDWFIDDHVMHATFESPLQVDRNPPWSIQWLQRRTRGTPNSMVTCIETLSINVFS